MKTFIFLFIFGSNLFAQNNIIAYSDKDVSYTNNIQIETLYNNLSSPKINMLGNEGLNPNLAPSPKYILKRKYTLKKTFLSLLFQNPNTSGVRIHFGMDNNGQVFLIFNPVEGQSLDPTSIDFVRDRPTYFAQTYQLEGGLNDGSTPIGDVLFQELKNNFKNSEFGYVHSYFIGKEKFQSLIRAGKNYLHIKIAYKNLSQNSIKKMFYLVFCDSANPYESFIQRQNTYFDFRFSLDEIYMGGGGAGSGNSKPCPPFGCNE